MADDDPGMDILRRQLFEAQLLRKYAAAAIGLLFVLVILVALIALGVVSVKVSPA